MIYYCTVCNAPYEDFGSLALAGAGCVKCCKGILRLMKTDDCQRCGEAKQEGHRCSLESQLTPPNPTPTDGMVTDGKGHWHKITTGHIECTPVNHPAHYNQHPSGVECIDIAEHYPMCIGNVIKYLWRAGLKEGAAELQDLKKAQWYLNREIERRERVKR